MTAVAIQHRDEIIAGLAEGKRLSDLNLSVSPQAISKVLKNDPEYREAIEAGLTVRLDQAEAALETAEATPEQVDVARARARFQSVAWRAERECPERWAQRTHTTVEIVGDLGDRLRRAQERLIDGEVVSEQHCAVQQTVESTVSLPQQIIEK